MPPRLSILLPTHNRVETLEWALRSLERQSERDFEVLICGDGCTDGTAALAQVWVAKDSRFRWFDFPKGPGFGYGHRNTVLEQARGEFIGFMAHDDLIFHDHYERMLAPMADPSVHLVASRPLWIDDSGTILPVANNLECSFAQERLFAGHHELPATCYLHRRSAFADVGWWDATLPRAADLDFWRRILAHYGPGSVRYLTTPGAFHFRAIWKTAADADPHQRIDWQRLLATPGAFPDILRNPPQENELLQAQIGRMLLAEDGFLWAQKIRRASELAIDSYAGELRQLYHAQSGQLMRLRAEKSQLKALLDAFRQKHETALARSNDLKTQFLQEQRRAEKWKTKCEAARLKKPPTRVKPRPWWRRLFGEK